MSVTPLAVLVAVMFFAVGTVSLHPCGFQQQKASHLWLAPVLQPTLGRIGAQHQVAAAQIERVVSLMLGDIQTLY